MKKIFYTIALSLLLFSCSKSSSNNTSPFKGNWTGTFSGTDDNGTFAASVDGDGKATGTATSNVDMVTYQLDGTMASNGVVSITFGTASSGGTFNGTAAGNSASGTWENKTTTPAFSGTWEGKKQ